MFEEKWKSLLEDDLDKLSEIVNPVKDKTIKLEEGENRIVSIFFLDIKGFTSMSEKMHPEEVKRIIDRIFKVFSNVIIKYGGYIDKYEGDMIMALFGSKKTTETDTERAIRSGLEILNKLRQINEMMKSQNIELSIRIGINTGMVTTGKVGLERESDFTVYGNMVNLASRMESNAPINSIMIPQKTKQIVIDTFEFESLGKIKVKGRTEPVEVFKVIGIVPQKVERWERYKLVKKPDYVGREKEFEKILELFAQSKAKTGEVDKDYKPFVVGLRGQAGLGKSRFIFEFIRNIKEPIKSKNLKNYILKGYTTSYAQAPYTLWTSLLKDYMNIFENDRKGIIKKKFESSISEITNYSEAGEKQNIERAKPILGFLLGLEYDDIRLQNPEPKRLQTEIQLGLRHFLEAAAKIANKEKFPMIIVLEDLHWIDEASLNAFKIILTALNVEEKRTNRPIKNIFFLLAYRNEFQHLREFEYRTIFNEFILRPLTILNSDKMITSMLGSVKFPEKIKSKLLKNSEGNPFYIEEWIHSLIDNNIIELVDNKWEITKMTEDISIPDTLNNLILARIDKMPERLKSLLQKASVIGNSFLKSILEAIEKKLDNKEDIDQELLKLINLDWLEKEKELEQNDVQYSFKHIITCDIAYKTILNYNKKILHRIIAEFAEEKFKDNEKCAFLAKHYEKSENKKKTIEYLQKAGDYEKENYNNGQAIDFYERLLTKEIDTKSRIDTLHKEGDILELIGKWKDAEEIFENALKLSQEIEDKKRIAKLYHSIGWQNYLKGNYAKAMDCYEKQLKISEELGDKSGISRAVGNMGVVYYEQGNYAKAMDCYGKQLKISEELGDKSGISVAVGNMGLIYKSQGNDAKAMECYCKQLKISEELGHKRGISIAVGNMGNVYSNQGNYAKAMECYEKDLKISEELGDKSGISIAVGNMGNVYRKQGNYAKAMDCYGKQLKISEELGHKIGISIAVGNMGNVYREQGNYAKAMECYEKVLKIDYELDLKPYLPEDLSGKSNCLYKMQKYTKAKEFNEKCYVAAKEFDNKESLFSSLVLKEKINFKLSKNNNIKIQCINSLESLLKDQKEENIATINYELAIMNSELRRNKKTKKHKREAIRLYNKLYKKTPKIEYKNKIEELAKLR